MAESTPNYREFAGLLTMLIEGTLPEDRRVRLNQLLREDPACRRLYIAEMSVHSMLLWTNDLSARRDAELDESEAFLIEVYEEARVHRIRLEAEAELARNLKAQAEEQRQLQRVVESPESPGRRRTIIIPKPIIYGGLAAAILLAVTLLAPMLQSSEPSIAPGRGLAEVVTEAVTEEVQPQAELVRSRGAVWDRAIPADQVLRGEEAWSLKQGFAEIAMPSGASVLLHGPVVFALIDDNTLGLEEGRLAAEVPERAKYFTVKTKSMDVVDLGTRFGVHVEPLGAASASVFEGKVEVHEPVVDPASEPRKVELKAGQQIAADSDGKLAETIADVAPDHGYVSSWEAVEHYVEIQGQARFFSTPPASVQHGDLSDTDHLIIFEESTVLLDQPLQAMADLRPRYSAELTTIPAGTKVISYFMHYNTDPADKDGTVIAKLRFPGRILGIIGNRQQLRGTNQFLGIESCKYAPDSQNTTFGIDESSPDHFTISGLQGDLLTINLSAGRFADQARVLVELPSIPRATGSD